MGQVLEVPVEGQAASGTLWQANVQFESDRPELLGSAAGEEDESAGGVQAGVEEDAKDFRAPLVQQRESPAFPRQQ